MRSFRRLGWLLDRARAPNVPLLEAALGKGALLLDLGGGTGRVARQMAYGRVLVCDPTIELLRRARGHGLTTVRCDARSLPFRTGSVDGAFLVDALHHIPDHDRVLAEAHRVLRPRGRLVVEEFDPTRFLGRVMTRLEGVLGFGSTFRSPDDLRARTEAAGFRATVERWNRRDYAVVAEKPG